MICSNLHEVMENPPDIPAFSGSVPKKSRKESVTDVLAGAALAFAKAFTSEKTNQTSGSASVSHPPVTSGVSPSKAIELRMKNLNSCAHLQVAPPHAVPILPHCILGISSSLVEKHEHLWVVRR